MEKSILIHKLLLKYGGSPWRFKSAMLTNFKHWEDISVLELFTLVVEIKDDLMCNYSLIPFFANYTGIDLRRLYPYINQKTEWSDENYRRLLSIFPDNFTFSEESLLENIGFGNLREPLEKLGARLVKELENFCIETI